MEYKHRHHEDGQDAHQTHSLDFPTFSSMWPVSASFPDSKNDVHYPWTCLDLDRIPEIGNIATHDWVFHPRASIFVLRAFVEVRAYMALRHQRPIPVFPGAEMLPSYACMHDATVIRTWTG